MVKKLVVVVLGLVAALAVTVPAMAYNPNPRGTLTYGIMGDIETLNPLLSENYTENQILCGLFANLLRANEKGELLPALAVEVPTKENGGISKDEKVYTFRLRKNVKWHDGVKLTAEDVKFTWEMLVNPDVAVVTREGWQDIKEFEIIDPYTFKITLEKPYAPFLVNFAAPSPCIVPKHVLGKVEPKEITKGQDFSYHPVGCGPYTLKEWKSGSYIMLEANKEFWGIGPYIEKIVFKVIPDTNTLLTAFKTGEIDMYQPVAAQYEEVLKVERAVTTLVPADIYLHITPDFRNPILADKAVRQALMYATPRALIVEKVLKGVGMVASTNIAPKSWAYNPNVKQYPFDQAKAKKLLADAGWKDVDKDGILEKGDLELSLEINTNAENKMRVQIEQVLQQYWKQVGVNLTIRNYEGSTLFGDILDNRKFQLIMFAWVSPPDPDPASLYRSTQIPTPENNMTGQNYSGFVNKEVDNLIEQQLVNSDRATRKKALGRIQEIVAEELPMFYIYYYMDVAVRPKNLINHKPSGSTTTDCWNMYEWQFK